jgi:ABC-type transporter Mla subunit MlaD
MVAILGLAGWLSTVAINGLPWSSPYQVRLVLPAGAPLLHSGDEVRIGGERAGQVQSVSLAPGRRSVSLATLALGGGFQVGPGAAARVRPLGLAGAVYVDLVPGRLRHPFASGALIRATAGVQITDVVAGFDSEARQALAQVLTRAGQGVAGRGAVLGQSLDNLPSLLTGARAVLEAVRPEPGELADDIGDSTALAESLSASGHLPGLVSAAAAVLHTTGAQADQVGAGIRAFPALERASAGVLPGADSLLAAMRKTAHALTPGVQALSSALPSMLAFEQASPSLSSLGTVADVAAGSLKALAPALRRLTGPASGLVPLSTPIDRLARVLIPYRQELVQAPLGFTRWGNFRYDFGGSGSGHRAVRFSMVLTCAHARDPYPRPGVANKEKSPCP